MPPPDYDCHALAEAFLMDRYTLDRVRIIHYYQSRYWVWQGRRYQPQPLEFLGDQLLLWLKHARKIGVKAVWEWTLKNLESILRVSHPPKLGVWLDSRSAEESSDEWLAVQNGILNLSELFRSGTTRIVGPNARWFCETVIPTDYLSGAECPVWERCLKEWLSNDETLIQFVQEFIGYCLLPDTRHGIGLFLEGEGANGKTVFCETLRQVLGTDNCSGVALHDWADRFSIIETVGKLVNFSTETEFNAKIPTARLKGFITSDAMSFRQLYQPSFTTKPTARLIVAWNRRPKIHDDSDGFWRRVRLVPFKRQFSVKDRDETLQQKLLLERAGILRWAVEGLHRLRMNGKFTPSPAVDASVTSFRTESDPLSFYCRTAYEKDPAGQLPKDDLYSDYVLWCQEKSHSIVNLEFFMKTLYRLWPEARPSRITQDGVRRQTVTGLRVRKEANEHQVTTKPQEAADTA